MAGRAVSDAAMPRVTVVVPTVGRLARLRACLACLAQQREAITGLVVVDDGLTNEGHADVARLVGDALLEVPCELVRTGGLGRAAARNYGAARATSAGVLFVDEDVLVAVGAVRRLANALHDVSFATSGIVELPQLAGWSDPASHPRFGHRLRPSVLRLVGARPVGMRLLRTAPQTAADDIGTRTGPLVDRIRFVTATGAILAIRRDVFVEHGGFDEGFGRDWGCEDLELGYRLLVAGADCRHLPMSGYHMTHARPGCWEEHDRTLARFQRLHPGPEVAALGKLLAPTGSYIAYRGAVEATILERGRTVPCET